MTKRDGDEPKLLSVPDAAVRLGLSYSSCYNRSLSGQLVQCRIGARRFVTVESVERLARELEQQRERVA